MLASESFLRITGKHYLYNITPIINIPSIIQFGILSHEKVKSLRHESIALLDVQEKRSRITVTNELVRRALYHLSSENNVTILSPKLDELAELLDDNDEGYTETLSALILSKVINCPAIIGEYRNPIPERYKDRVVRPYRFPEVASIMTVQTRIE